MGVRRWNRLSAGTVAGAMAFCALSSSGVLAQTNPGKENACCAKKSPAKREARSPKRAAAPVRFSARADTLMDAAPESKGDWGLLIVDAQTGAVLSTKQFGGVRGLAGWVRESLEHKQNTP